jgi:hypothetical protein
LRKKRELNMLIEYFSDGMKLYARIYGESGYRVYTCGWLDDGSAEEGIITLHNILINIKGVI